MAKQLLIIIIAFLIWSVCLSGCIDNENKKPTTPFANFNYEPSDPWIFHLIYFKSTSYDPDGNIVNWTWDFGDGNISYLENTTHQYSNNGTYTVGLTIIDNNNAKDYVEQNIIIDIFPFGLSLFFNKS